MGRSEAGPVAFSTLPPEEKAEVLEIARDFRGDVTLELGSGGRLTGFVFAVDPDGDPPSLRLLPADGGGRRTVAWSDVASLAFDGRDFADGRAWRAWLRRKGLERA